MQDKTDRLLDFIDYLRAEERSAGTIEKYMRDVRKFFCWLGDKTLEKVQVSAWKAHLLTDGYAAICNAHDPGIVSSLLCEDRTGGLHVETALLPGQSGPFFGRMASDLFQVSENPVFSGMKERVDKGTGTSVRGAHRDLAVAAYLYGGCFPAAVYDLVCKWKFHVITSKTSVT